MTQPDSKTVASKRLLLSVDVWAVLVALLAALFVRTGIITRVPW